MAARRCLRGGLIGPDDVDAALAGGFRAEGPLVSSPIDAPVLDIGSGPAPANLGVGGESVVIIVRTDVVDTFPIDRVLNAEGVLADDLVNSAQAVIINNPYNYRPNLAELGRAVRPGGKIIIQGHREANKYFRGLLKQGPPKGFKLSPDEGFDPVVDLTPAAKADPDVMTDAIRRNILGGPFRSTSPEGRAPQPNVRVVTRNRSRAPKPWASGWAVSRRPPAPATTTSAAASIRCNWVSAMPPTPPPPLPRRLATV